MGRAYLYLLSRHGQRRTLSIPPLPIKPLSFALSKTPSSPGNVSVRDPSMASQALSPICLTSATERHHPIRRSSPSTPPQGWLSAPPDLYIHEVLLKRSSIMKGTRSATAECVPLLLATQLSREIRTLSYPTRRT